MRLILLYNYGGCWFDSDCLFLRSFDPLFCKVGKEISVYRWGPAPYPLNAIIISLEKNSIKLKKNMIYIMNLNRGWGFQNALLTYDLPLDFLVLPFIWFERYKKNFYNDYSANWIFDKTDNKLNFNNFCKGAFCFHWHNMWDEKVEDNCILKQLVKIIETNLKELKTKE